MFSRPGFMGFVHLEKVCDDTDGKLQTGPHLNIKTVLSTYGDSHVKDKTAARTSYL